MGTRIVYLDISPTAKADMVVTASSKNTFIKLDDLKFDINIMPYVETLEDNFWTLNGSFELFPDNPEDYSWGYWSDVMSDATGVFSSPVVIEFYFKTLQDSSGLAIEFCEYGDNYCSLFNVTWLSGGNVVKNINFKIDNWRFFYGEPTNGYDKVVLTLYKTSRPFRYVKIQNIVFGSQRVFEERELENVSVYAAASPISQEVEYNTLDFTLRSEEEIPYLFVRKQPLAVAHNQVSFGTYYITASKRTGLNTYDIQAVDSIGLLDNSTFKGGIYIGITTRKLINNIISSMPYQIDSALASITLSGWLPISTKRDALTQVAFAIGAVVDTSGEGAIKIFKPKETVKSDIQNNRIFMGSDIDTSDIITGVEITEHSYNVGNEVTELFKGEVSEMSEITFSEPMHSLTIMGGTILKSEANYALISGNGGDVVLSGKKYIHTTRLVVLNNKDIGKSDLENIIRVEDFTLISPLNSLQTANRVYEYYQYRETVNSEIVMIKERVSDKVTINTDFSGIKTGAIKSMDISFGGELTAQITVIGGGDIE